MTVYFEKECDVSLPFDCEKTARKVVGTALEVVNCPYEAEVSVTVTTDGEIQKINREQRGIDAPTDVLSFPMAEYPAPGAFDFLEKEQTGFFHPDSGELMLGDIVISADRVMAQAKEYGHSPLREFAFLVAHSMLHLVGYDHMTDEQARGMEETQEHILEILNITRDLQHTE